MHRSLRFGMRALVRRPVVAVASVLCLSVGLAASGAAWTLVEAALLEPFGLSHSDELVVVWESDPSRNQALIEVSLLNFQDWQRESRTLTSMAAFGSQHWPSLARIGSETLPLRSRGVSQSFFSTLGVRPALGRDFLASDARPDVPPPLLLSHRLWLERFGGAPSAVGQTVFVDGVDHLIVGVMPRGFAYPEDPDAYIFVERVLSEAFQQMPAEQQRRIGVLEVLGRRQPQASLQDVRAELTAIMRALRERHSPAAGASTVTAAITPFTDVLVGRLGSRLWIALGMALAVLLFACANITVVRLAALRERAAELGARIVLGATRRRLVTELAIEAAPLVLLSTALAIGEWRLLVQLLAGASAVSDSGLPLLADVRGGVVVVLALGVVSWAIVALASGVSASRALALEDLLSGARVARRASRIGAPLLFGQAAIAIGVVTLAAAAVQTFAHLSRIDPGFKQRDVTLIDIGLPEWKYSSIAEERDLVERLQSALRDLPGAERVAAVSVRPFRFGEIVDGLPVRRSADALVQPDEALAGSRVVVTPDYFAAIGQPIVEGRGFTELDRADAQSVAVVSRTLARALFGDGLAVGRQLETFSLSEKWRSRVIVGIAGDARYRGLERPSMEVYVPHTQATPPLGSLVLATTAGARVTTAEVRGALRRIEPDIAIEGIQTSGELLDSVLGPARLLTQVMALLGSAGLLLLGIGIFGAAAAAVSAAWHEIAVRQALGALPLQAAQTPLRSLTRALMAGTALGLALIPVILSAAAALGLSVSDGAVAPVAAATVIVVAAALVAVAPALWRATRTSPAELLRRT